MAAITTIDTQNKALVALFDSALKNAAESLKLTGAETLGRVAQEYFAAFETARNLLADHGTLPVVPGNDPHNVSSDDNSPIRVALSGVYGFTMSDQYTEKSPNAIQTLKHLKPIADAIHLDGYSIFT